MKAQVLFEQNDPWGMADVNKTIHDSHTNSPTQKPWRVLGDRLDRTEGRTERSIVETERSKQTLQEGPVLVLFARPYLGARSY